MKIEDFNQYGISYVDALAFYREYTSPQLSNIERASLAKAFANNHGFHVAMTYRLLDLVNEREDISTETLRQMQSSEPRRRYRFGLDFVKGFLDTHAWRYAISDEDINTVIEKLQKLDRSNQFTFMDIAAAIWEVAEHKTGLPRFTFCETVFTDLIRLGNARIEKEYEAGKYQGSVERLNELLGRYHKFEKLQNSIKEYMGNQYYGFWMSLFKLFRGYRIKKSLVSPKVLKRVAKNSNKRTKEVQE
jgi:hypothetical protein